MKTLIIALVLFLVVKVYSEKISVNELLNEEWEDYKSKYLKTYKNDEEYSRRRIWEENVRYIQKHNIQYDLGKYQYFLGINQFADMSNEEFREKYLKPLKDKNKRKGIKFMAPLNLIQLPTTVNWVMKGYVTPVKNQGQCGSCWTFSTTGSVEGQYFRKTHYLISLSEQQLVDCSGSFGTQGCNGGWMDDAFDYIQAFGIESEKDYPYSAVSGNCKYNATKVVTKISGHVDIDSDNEESLAIAVATQGPVSVAIDANQPSFQFYKGGVYNEPDCSTTNLDHAVLVVGYGIDSSKNYWLVKNSWGTSWGIQGYIQMSKDENNQCGIASKASYPTI